MRELIEHENRKVYNLVKKERYIAGNRPSRLLAKVLSKKKNNNYIDKITKLKQAKLPIKT